MIGSRFSFFNPEQISLLRGKVLDLLESHGVKLDPHPEMLALLSQAGAAVDRNTHMVRFPRNLMEAFIEKAPKKFILGAMEKEKILPLPRPDGTFYSRTNTGAHGWIEPETGAYRKVMRDDLSRWARLVHHLDEINFVPFLFTNDSPTRTADIHGLNILLQNTSKHIWVQPYSAASIEYLIRLGETAAGGSDALKTNPVISMIACSLSPRAFKNMDIEIILRSARASLPIHACSLPGAGGTAPATGPGVILLAAAEILAMLAMAQAVAPGAPVVACPIIFSTDMRSGRSLQSSPEAMAAASGAVQLIKSAFGLPTHNYGSGSDSPTDDGQSMTERAMLTTLMGTSGLDILGGAGQLEVATVVSPLQLMVDNEVIGMVRCLMKGFTFDQDHLGWDVLMETRPGDQFLTSDHTLFHCRDAFKPQNFTRLSREAWEKQGSKDLMDRIRERYRILMEGEKPYSVSPELARKLDTIVKGADEKLQEEETQ